MLKSMCWKPIHQGLALDRVSDGMRSYFEKANAQTTSNLNPTAAAYNPESGTTDFLPPPLVVCPKEKTGASLKKISRNQCPDSKDKSSARNST